MGKATSSRNGQQEPLVPEVGVIAMVPDTWSEIWAPRHQVMTRLARYYRVVWIDPPLNWREFWLPGSAAQRAPFAPTPEIPAFEVLQASRWHPRVHRPRFAA